MKAIKKNFENLKKVCDSITSVPFPKGDFVVYYQSDDTITLISFGRDFIGGAILNMIPSNYCYGVTFNGNDLRLTIWFD